ncbi:Crp/Fnr family transcriptional regulator [Flavihumibacter profundi]|uniref:Crp/Fnr family transcriptional regulator n=1 Tax=Flavihumibacter profundi TaxID=2716883 RepID=UPI001CC4CEDC|nr:Crp/Fnr family transcriptional regulator [Flavihumibacter profundi]MBZ5857103.1 Crp/Fnr family transcriptional regulator [Flavihumibacter profundi]
MIAEPIVPEDVLLTWGATYKKVAKGEIIFLEGTNASFYYQIIEGRVRWVNINEEGREFIQVMIESGECFGELPLFDDKPYAATAIADEDCVLLRLCKSSFLQMIKSSFDIHFSFTKLLVSRLRFKFQTLRELAYNNPEQRISTMLNYYKRTRGGIGNSLCKLHLTRQQLADMTGLRVETVIRTIRHLHERGSLKIQRGKVFY